MTKKEAKALTAERARLFRAQSSFEHTDRIPHFASAVTWKIFDAGYTIDQAVVNHDIMEKCVRHFLETYYVDGLIDTGIRNQFEVMQAFGSEGYYYYTPEVVGIHDHGYVKVDELMEYLEDPKKYAWEKILPQKYGEDWYKKSMKTWKDTYKAYYSYTMFVVHMAMVSGEYGIPVTAPNNPSKDPIDFGIESLLSNFLGIKELSTNLRRKADLIEEFCMKFDEQHINPIIEKALESNGPNPKYCFDANIMMLAHNIMSPAQFERFYWPTLSRFIDAYNAKGMHIRSFTEGKTLGFKDYFKDYNKGTLTFHIEQDDPFEFRRELPNVAIMGGLSTTMLYSESKETCVETAKKLCDGLGTGFIISENKMMSYKNDCNSENYKAVCDFLRDYRL